MYHLQAPASEKGGSTPMVQGGDVTMGIGEIAPGRVERTLVDSGGNNAAYKENNSLLFRGQFLVHNTFQVTKTFLNTRNISTLCRNRRNRSDPRTLSRGIILSEFVDSAIAASSAPHDSILHCNSGNIDNEMLCFANGGT